MTREQATQNIDEIDFLTWQIDIIEDMLDQIFNDHEAQLKAKDEITQDIKEAYELKSIAYDLLLKAIKLKDEEIERLKEENNNLHRLMGQNRETINEAKKARSIVAMLFWEYKKLRYTSDGYFHNDEEIENAYYTFKKAYKMLEDNK